MKLTYSMDDGVLHTIENVQKVHTDTDEFDEMREKLFVHYRFFSKLSDEYNNKCISLPSKGMIYLRIEE